MTPQSALIDAFGAHLATSTASDSTRRAYMVDINQFAEHLHKEYAGAGLSTDELLKKAVVPDVAAFLGYLANKNYTQQSAYRKLAGIHKFYKWAYEKNRMPLGRLHKTHPQQEFRKQGSIVQPISAEALGLFRTYMQKEGRIRDLAIVNLILATGCRASRVLKLRVSQVVLDATDSFCTVRMNVHQTYNLANEAAMAMHKQAASLSAQGKLLDDMPFFPNKHGKTMSPRSLRRNLEEHCGKAGIEMMTPARMRKTYLRDGFEAKTPELAMANSLGIAVNRIRVLRSDSQQSLAS